MTRLWWLLTTAEPGQVRPWVLYLAAAAVAFLVAGAAGYGLVRR